MRHNVGSADKWFRLLLGIVLLTLVFSGPHTPWGWLGLIPLLTGVFGFCPLYAMLGWSTYRPAGHGHA